MPYEKITGSALLLAGLLIIGYSIYLGMKVFVNAQNPPEIFKAVDMLSGPQKSPAVNPAASLPKNLNELNPADLQKMLGSGNLVSPEMIKSLIPPEIFGYIPRIMNLSAFSIFLWILITAGAKVSSLGISLIKTNSNIKV